MKKIKLTMCLTLVIAAGSISAIADDGQIPIGGRPAFETVKTATPISVTDTVDINDNSSQIKSLLRAIVDYFGQYDF